MTIEFPFIAVDWGTSRMRAMLCESATTVDPARIEGEGISALREEPARALLGAVEPWTREYGRLDFLLAGMVGSSIGWRNTPYLACPLHPRNLADELTTFSEQGHRVAIVPGVSCMNWLGQPDVMRGEEVQVLGWLNHASQARDSVLCLPGTHTKWVRVRDGRLADFTTSLTGELYALLKRYSVLASTAERDSPAANDAAFLEGVDVAAEHGAHLLHTVFSTRSRALINPGAADYASSYLSGLLIGSDAWSAMKCIETGGGVVELIGATTLCERFAMVLERMGYESRISNGDEMVLKGFLDIAESLQ